MSIVTSSKSAPVDLTAAVAEFLRTSNVTVVPYKREAKQLAKAKRREKDLERVKQAREALENV